MKIIQNVVVAFSLFMIMAAGCACSSDPKEPGWDWDGEDPGEEVEAKPRYLWVDAAANFPDYANSKDNIKRDLTLAKNTGFTDIVVDVRPTMGDVLFSTSVEQQVKKLDYWSNSGYQFYERTETWDYLQAFVDIAHQLDIKIHAAINTFTAGNDYPYGLGQQGLLFRDDSKKNWATSVSLETGITNVMDLDNKTYSTKFLNPVNPDVQNYLLALLEDLAKYDIDGIFLDRCRFDDIKSDFSDYTREKFEAYLGSKVENFPGDIMPAGTEATPIPSPLPKHYKKWLEFRAKTIHDFVAKARDRVKSQNQDIKFGVYVGAWYSTYYDVGVNWASPKYNTAATYPAWASDNYKDYGYADHLDFMLLGAYASADRIYGNSEWTIQGFCKNAKNLLLDDVKFAGGPDVGNWNVPEGTNVNTAVANTVDAAINAGNGYFLFDIIHLKMHNYWPDVKKGIDKYLESIENKKGK
ncbi:S-layer protein [Dysgonomonas sp. 521]|uniref:alpha amylase family protein n=1 Tax=Dysgonomonas sp. 521 TaxID=2302932 RepID=UPI0013D635F7|nr:alpha amylase family protein [Dysgonomonas sp. 521]NDV96364.1 S-layer protein [Dysgonomonas sp. 521]